jgi:formate dehydrogenase subunit delta
MDANKLVAMANQIAAFFAADPDRTAAIDGVAGHLQKFWEPRMRREILARLDESLQHGGQHGMHELVVAALTERRQALTPAP